VDGVLQPALVATEPRSDGQPGGVSHCVATRRFESRPLVPTEDLGPEEDLCVGLELHPSWMWDFLDPVTRDDGDAQVFQQSPKPASGD
jgi:hypothetical protein